MFLGYFRMPAKGHSKFQCVEEPNHSIAIQNAYFRLKKQGMLSSLRAACFLHKGTQKTQKITLFEAYMQRKLQFIAYLHVLWTLK